MAALTAGRLVDTKQLDAVQGGYVQDFLIVDADIIFQGALVTYNATGELTPAAVGVGKMVLGIAQATVDNAADGLRCPVLVGGVIVHDVTSTTQANIGDPVFATDDQTLVLTPGTNPYAGQIIQFVSGDECIIQMPKLFFQPAVYTITNHADLRTFDAASATNDELADVLGTLLIDLKNRGIIDADVT